MKRRTVLITGGTAGLGSGLVTVFLNNNWNVATFGRRAEPVKTLERENVGRNLLVEPCDMTLSNQVDTFLNSTWEKFGGIDLAILNAGALGPTPLAPIEDLKLDSFREVYETNVFGNISLMLKLIKRTGNQPFTLIHVTSDAGSTPYENWAPYGSSKAAMDLVIRILKSECKRMKAFNFDPGDMNTEMHREALPDDNPKTLRDPYNCAVELFNIIRNGDYL